MSNNEKAKYELFCDDSYYHMWCVRSLDDKRFNSPMSFHFMLEKDAIEFKRLIELAR
jgi:hypothetical protein